MLLNEVNPGGLGLVKVGISTRILYDRLSCPPLPRQSLSSLPAVGQWLWVGGNRNHRLCNRSKLVPLHSNVNLPPKVSPKIPLIAHHQDS